jgi:carbonyl reductase 1
MEETINTNYFGPRRVNEAFGKLLQRPGGRIVNVASASAPKFLGPLPDSSELKQKLMKPWTLPGGAADIDEIARGMKSGDDGYGASKALLNAYTAVHAKLEPDLFINSCSPGFILTDLTAGTTASNPPSKGAVPPCYLMMDESTVPSQPTGRYYGSDCVRSPFHFYRGPGEAPYDGDEDLVDLPESAQVAGSKLAEISS